MSSSFILGFIFHYHPYYSLLTSFHSIPVCLLISSSYQHCYTWIIKHQLWLHSDFILSKQCMFHSETQHPRLLYCFSYFIILYMFHLYLGIQWLKKLFKCLPVLKDCIGTECWHDPGSWFFGHKKYNILASQNILDHVIWIKTHRILG